MTIDEAHNQLSAYLDDELDEPARRAVAEALAAHPELRRQLDALRRTAQLVSATPRIPAPDGLADRVVAAIQASPRPSPLRRWHQLAAAAAACLVAALAAWLALQPPAPRTKAYTTPAPARPTRHPAQPGTLTRALTVDEAVDARAASERTAKSLAAPTQPARTEAALDRMAPGPGTLASRAKGTGGHGGGYKKSDQPTDDDAWRYGAKEAGKSSFRAANGAIAAAAQEELPSQKLAHRAGRLAAEHEADIVHGYLADKHRLSRGRRADALALAQDDLVAAILERQQHAYYATRDGRIAETRFREQPHVAKLEAPTPKAKPPLPEPPGEPEQDADAPLEGAATAAGPVVAEQITYGDLHAALAGAQGALRDANVPFAIQPLGMGHFVIEADMPQGEARALLARLGRPPAPQRAIEPPGPAPLPGATLPRPAAPPGARPGPPQSLPHVLHNPPPPPAPPPAGQAAPAQRPPAPPHNR